MWPSRYRPRDSCRRRHGSKNVGKYETEQVGLRLWGWSGTGEEGGGNNCYLDGYSVYDFFDENGTYLGPDTQGIEPIFDDDMRK